MNACFQRWATLTFLVSITVACFYSGLSGPFVLDDSVNITFNEKILLTQLTWDQLYLAITTPTEGYPFGRAIAYLTFALNYYFSDFVFNKFTIKLCNVLVHAFNSGLVFLIINTLLKRINSVKSTINPTTIAMFAALLWACHPIQVSAVLYAVQRMTLLAGTSTLLGCYLYVNYRLNSNYGKGLYKLILGLTACLIIGFHAKESAILLPLYLVALEAIIRAKTAPDKKIDILIIALVLIPGILGITYLFIDLGNIRESYIFRNFTLEERLLTQPRVLFWYLKLIFLPNLSDYSIFLDDFVVSKSFFNPISTFGSIAGWLAIILTAILYRKNGVLLAAVIWFLGGHLIESSFIPLEIAFEHRNYIPSLAPILLALFIISTLLNRSSSKPLLHIFVLSGVTSLIFFLAVIRSTYWGDDKLFIVTSIDHRPHSSRARSTAGLFFVSWAPLTALEHYRIASKHNPDAIDPLTNQYVIISSIYNLYEKPSGAEDVIDMLDKARSLWSKAELADELATLDKEIQFRFQTQAISAQALTVLERTTNCRVNDQIGCMDAATVLRWVEIALSNPKKRKGYQAFIMLFQAKLLAYLGRTDDALAIMLDIVNNRSDLPHFKIHLGRLYQALGEELEAKQYLEKLSPSLLERYWDQEQAGKISPPTLTSMTR